MILVMDSLEQKILAAFDGPARARNLSRIWETPRS